MNDKKTPEQEEYIEGQIDDAVEHQHDSKEQIYLER